MNILLAVDGSAYTQKILDYLAAHAELLGSGQRHYTALTVQTPLPPRARAALSKDAIDSYYADEAAAVLNPVLQFLSERGCPATARAEIGSAGETIAQAARQGQFDLIIMGTRGHGSLGGLIMGSVSAKVLAGCTTPVLLIR